jgi:hypothetical protein
MPGNVGVGSLAYGGLVNWQAPLNRELLSWFLVLPLGMGGQAWGDLVSGAVAVLSNMAGGSATSGFASTTRPGGLGEMRFDGINDVVKGAVPPRLRNVWRRTVTAWIKLVGYGGNNVGRIIEKRDPGFGWNFAVNNLNVTAGLSMNQDFSSSGGNWGVGNVLSTGVWLHAGVVYDANSPSNLPAFYVNGLPTATASVITAASGSALDDSTSPLTLGDQNTGGRMFSGAIDDVRVLGRLATPSEMLALFMASRQGYPRELNRQTWPPLGAVPPPTGPRRRWVVGQALMRRSLW